MKKKSNLDEKSLSQLAYLNELLEETILMAEEAGRVETYDSFEKYLEEMIPSDLLNILLNEASANVEDLWAERFGPKILIQENIENTQITEEEFGEDCCLICERVMNLTRHHLIPREMHERCAKKFGTETEILNKTISICRLCHNAIHRFFTNAELAMTYNTFDALMDNEKMYKFAKWASGLKSNGQTKMGRS